MNFKKILSLAMIFVFVFSVMSITKIMADDSSVQEISTLEELKNAVSNGGEYKLTGSIELDGVLTVASNAVVTIDLNGNNIIQTVAEKNAIYNLGSLTVNDGVGTGCIEGLWNGIYNENVITINGGTIKGANNGLYNGDAWWDDDGNYNSYPGTATINGGNFIGETYSGVYNAADSTITVSNGEFTGGIDGYGFCSDSADSAVAITGGKYSSVFGGCTITDGNYVAEDTFDAKITGGTFTVKNATIAGTIEGGVFTFDNATLDAKITGGTFDGTVASVTTKTISGGTFTQTAKESIDAFDGKWETFYKFVEAENNTYTAVKKAYYNLKVISSDDNKGEIKKASYKHGGGSGNVSGSIDKNVLEGKVTISVTEIAAAENYEFVGWYTNAEGTGTAISTEETLSDYEIEIYSDTVIYAVFVETAEYNVFVEAANLWLGDYANTTAYEITNKDDMAYFAYAVNDAGEDFSGKTVTLKANLEYAADEKYTPVGNAEKVFKGTFDGGNYTISGLNLSGSYIGVFGNARANIKNLTVKDCVLDGSSYYAYAGGIAGEAGGKIENCKAINVDVKGWFSGCIIGHTFGMTITDVTVDGGSAAGGKSGGIAGYADDLTLTNASVSGLKTANSSGAIGGHINYGTFKFTDITVKDITSTDDTNTCMVGTAYGSAGNIIISGDSNVTVDKIVAGEIVGSVTVKGEGTYIADDVNNYVEDGYEYDSTSGTIVLNDWDYAVATSGNTIRFLFDYIADGEVTETGIKFVKTVGADYSAAGGLSEGGYKTFYGDVTDVPESATFYAVGYAVVDGETKWAIPQVGTLK